MFYTETSETISRCLYLPKVVPYEEKHVEAGLSILNGWQSSLDGQKTDFHACEESLKIAKELDLLGYIVYIDEQPAAFILGEEFPDLCLSSILPKP